jgi:hypothetical protein
MPMALQGEMLGEVPKVMPVVETKYFEENLVNFDSG